MTWRATSGRPWNEILGIVEEGFLRLHWRVNLWCVVTLLLFVLPFVHIHKFLTSFHRGPFRQAPGTAATLVASLLVTYLTARKVVYQCTHTPSPHPPP